MHTLKSMISRYMKKVTLILLVIILSVVIYLQITNEQRRALDGVNLLSESNRQNTPVTCFRFDNCLYYICFFLFLQSPYVIFQCCYLFYM